MLAQYNVQHEAIEGDVGTVPRHIFVPHAAKQLDRELLAACSDTQGYNTAGLQRSGVCVGNKQWSIFTRTDRLTKLEQKVDTLDKQVASLSEDAIDNGQIRLQLVATQALLFAAGESAKGFTSFRFGKLLNTTKASQLTHYTQVVNSRQTVPASEDAVANMLDTVINTRNAFVHYRNEAAFHQEAILSAQQLIQRHPKLSERCPVEVLIIQTYDSLKSCFEF